MLSFSFANLNKGSVILNERGLSIGVVHFKPLVAIYDLVTTLLGLIVLLLNKKIIIFRQYKQA
jgi:hypothetical protein